MRHPVLCTISQRVLISLEILQSYPIFSWVSFVFLDFPEFFWIFLNFLYSPLFVLLVSRFFRDPQGFSWGFQGFSGVSPRFICNLVTSRTLSMSNSLFSFGSIAWSLKGRNGQAEQALGLKKGGLFLLIHLFRQRIVLYCLLMYVLLCSAKPTKIPCISTC